MTDNGQGDFFDGPPPPEDDPPKVGLSFEQLLAMERVPVAKCPYCTRTLKVYKWKLGSYATFLIWLYRTRTSPEQWLHIRNCPKEIRIDGVDVMIWNGGGDYAKLEWWELIENKPLAPKSKQSSSGQWRITPKGVQYVRNELALPKYAFYKPPLEVLGWHTDLIMMSESIPAYFNYRALMRGEW